jgi:transposase
MVSLSAEIESLRAALAARGARLADVEAELTSRDLLIEKLKHQLAGMQRHRFGTSSEALDQLELRLEDEEIAAAAERPGSEHAADADADAEKGVPKRRPLPDHLPCDEVVLTPCDACATCGGTLRRLGEDATDELEYQPGRFVVNRIVRPRMACTCCERIVQAALPSRPIERGRPGPGLLAHVLVSKYADHLPLHRQSRIFERDGIDLGRSTLADWVGRVTALLEPLADAIGQHVRAGEAIFADDTTLKMLAPGTGRTKTARVWVYARDERPWWGEGPPAAWYRFSTDRKAEHPAQHLKGFRGFMHADGYAGFKDLFRAGEITDVACMAHIRRKFVDVHQSRDPPSPRRRCAGSPASMRSRRRRGAVRQTRGLASARTRPRRSSMICKPGSASSSPVSPGRRRSPARSATPSAGCRRRAPISTTVTWNWTTTAPSAACAASSALSHCAPLVQLSGNIGSCLWAGA